MRSDRRIRFGLTFHIFGGGNKSGSGFIEKLSLHFPEFGPIGLFGVKGAG